MVESVRARPMIHRGKRQWTGQFSVGLCYAEIEGRNKIASASQTTFFGMYNSVYDICAAIVMYFVLIVLLYYVVLFVDFIPQTCFLTM